MVWIKAINLRLRSAMLTLVAMVDIGLIGTSLLDIRILKVSTDSTILSVGIEMLVEVHLLVSPTVNIMSSSSGVKSTPSKS